MEQKDPEGRRRDGLVSQSLVTASGKPLDESIRDAWTSTRMEFDKQLLTLSSAGIALLVTLSQLASPAVVAVNCIVAGLVGFTLCTLVTLAILRTNAAYLEAEKGRKQRLGICLMRLDRVAMLTFVVGVVGTSAAGFAMAFMRHTR